MESDLLGAARGLLVRRPGLACIIGTGSNSCLYDGNEIVRNVAPLGYILGDEGSSAYLGKVFIGPGDSADCPGGREPGPAAALPADGGGDGALFQ